MDTLPDPVDSGITNKGRAAAVQGLDPAILAQIEALLQQGNKIGAVKLYRAATGALLRVAMDAVEVIDAGEHTRPPFPGST